MFLQYLTGKLLNSEGPLSQWKFRQQREGAGLKFPTKSSDLTKIQNIFSAIIDSIMQIKAQLKEVILSNFPLCELNCYLFSS